MYVCMCLCVYVCIYIFVSVCAYVCTYACMYVPTHVCKLKKNMEGSDCSVSQTQLCDGSLMRDTSPAFS
jgi:hypothetical protein